ncbi:flagellar hook-basal body complex protein [Desulfotruncus alcoholivorax]|uniref:flagellar hook-basal body complex protein n=1 Tax=Desulfotruncus alcoholivorax TaxID=265477 RepID=UPI000428D498|nr:flagellar hook-basal body complex protein [Desulfotruncus alcoholivorax]
MIRSLFSGVSGMKNHQIRMDVIGNNIANVNTVGFKRGRVNFEDTLYQTIKSSSKTSNPAQAGLGTAIASITSDMNSGGLQSTGRNLDLAINGDGFFRFTDPKKSLDDPSNQLYGREGTLYINNNGSIVNSNGLQLVAYQWKRVSVTGTNPAANITADGDLVLQKIKTDPGTLSEALPRTTPLVKISLTAGMTIDQVIEKINEKTNSTGVVASKDASGKLVLSSELNSLDGFSIDATSTGQVLTDLGLASGDNKFDKTNAEYGQRALQIDPGSIPVGSIQFLDDGTVIGYDQNGNSLQWTDEQGNKYDSTMIKLYTFPNQDGLERVDKNIFTTSVSSGKEQEGMSGSTGYGTIVSGYLEMSNVDLTDEFSTMITTQRGYQASARMITVSDTMLEELLNLKR